MNDYNKALELIQANKIFGAEDKNSAWLILAIHCWFQLTTENRERVYKHLESQIGK